jgi:hypothetical protein
MVKIWRTHEYEIIQTRSIDGVVVKRERGEWQDEAIYHRGAAQQGA